MHDIVCSWLALTVLVTTTSSSVGCTREDVGSSSSSISVGVVGDAVGPVDAGATSSIARRFISAEVHGTSSTSNAGTGALPDASVVKNAGGSGAGAGMSSALFGVSGISGGNGTGPDPGPFGVSGTGGSKEPDPGPFGVSGTGGSKDPDPGPFGVSGTGASAGR
jgi:hypothetical protein